MRYLIAMIVAAAFALGATLLVSSRVATWVVAQFAFENPDQVANMHGLVFMGVNAAALLLGWFLGWTFAARAGR